LGKAIENNTISTLKKIVFNKVDFTKIINIKDYYPEGTMLHKAVTRGNLDFVTELLKYNPALDLKNRDGNTALEIAHNLHYEEIENLIKEKSQ